MNSSWTKDEVKLLAKVNRLIEGLGPEVKKNEEKFIQLRNTSALNALQAFGYKERKPEEIHSFFTHRFPKIIVKAKDPKVSDIPIPENVDRSLSESNLSTLPNTPITSTDNNKKRVISDKRKNYLRERRAKYHKIRKTRKKIEKQLKIIQSEMELSARTGNSSFEHCTDSVNDTSSFHTHVTYCKYKNLESEHEDEHKTNSSNCESPRRYENQFNQINVICSGYNRDQNRNFTSAGFHAYNNKRHYRTYNKDNCHNIEKQKIENISFPSEHQTAQPTVFLVRGHELKLKVEKDENSVEDKTGLPGKQTPRKACIMTPSIIEYYATQESENSTEPIVDSENQCQTTSSIPNFFQYDLSRTDCRDLLYRNPSPLHYFPYSPSFSPVTTVPAIMNVTLPTSVTPSPAIQGSAMSS